MAVTVAQFKSKFPEFAATSAATVQACLDMALRNVNECAWGTRTDDGVMWLGAHLLKTSAQGSGGTSGPITGKSVGDVSVSYASVSLESAGGFGTTAYGLQYSSLRSLIFAPRCL